MNSLSGSVSGAAGYRSLCVIEAGRMARHPVFLLGVTLGHVVLGVYFALDRDDTGVPVVLTLPLLGAFYIGLTTVIAAALLTGSTDPAAEAVTTAPGTEARRTLALAAAGLPPLVAGLVFTVALVVGVRVIGVAPQEWWFGTLPSWQVWCIVLMCPVVCLDAALLGVLTGRWLRFRGASVVVVVALITVSLLGQVPLLGTDRSEWRLWVPWALFSTGDNPDGTQTLIAGNPAAYLGYLLALGVLAVLAAICHDRGARTPRLRAIVVAVTIVALSCFALAVTTGNRDNRTSDPIPSRVTR